MGIIAGLVLGKFAGIFIISWLAVKMKIASLAAELNWGHLLGASLLGGIGFTMSIFYYQPCFLDDAIVITASKMSILLASVAAAVLGLFILKMNTIRKKSIKKHYSFILMVFVCTDWLRTMLICTLPIHFNFWNACNKSTTD